MRENFVCRHVKMQTEGAFPGFSSLLNCHLINYRPFILRLTCWASLSTSVCTRSVVSRFFFLLHVIVFSFPFLPHCPPLSLSLCHSDDFVQWTHCGFLSLPVKWNGRVSLPFYSANSQLPIRRYNGVRKNTLLQLNPSVCICVSVCVLHALIHILCSDPYEGRSKKNSI